MKLEHFVMTSPTDSEGYFSLIFIGRDSSEEVIRSKEDLMSFFKKIKNGEFDLASSPLVTFPPHGGQSVTNLTRTGFSAGFDNCNFND